MDGFYAGPGLLNSYFPIKSGGYYGLGLHPVRNNHTDLSLVVSFSGRVRYQQCAVTLCARGSAMNCGMTIALLRNLNY